MICGKIWITRIRKFTSVTIGLSRRDKQARIKNIWYIPYKDSSNLLNSQVLQNSWYGYLLVSIKELSVYKMKIGYKLSSHS